MSEYEATGRTIEDAVEVALASLGIKKENALIEVLEEPTHGLLGIIGNRNARVIVTPKHSPSSYLQEYLEVILDLMKIDGSVEIAEDEEKIRASVFGNSSGMLIGRRGRTLSDLQYLINIIVRRQFASLGKMVVLDVENYRARREKTLTHLAFSVARRVTADGREQALEPMNPQERRIIHLALQDHDGVTTHSTGEEPNRKVVVAPN